MVFFGGSPVRRYEVTRQLRSIPQPSICGTLSEVEGPQAIDQLSKVALVLIGGRYDAEQRQRSKEHLAQMHPHFRVTEPGIYCPYNAAEIKKRLEILVASV